MHGTIESHWRTRRLCDAISRSLVRAERDARLPLAQCISTPTSAHPMRPGALGAAGGAHCCREYLTHWASMADFLEAKADLCWEFRLSEAEGCLAAPLVPRLGGVQADAVPHTIQGLRGEFSNSAREDVGVRIKCPYRSGSSSTGFATTFSGCGDREMSGRCFGRYRIRPQGPDRDAAKLSTLSELRSGSRLGSRLLGVFANVIQCGQAATVRRVQLESPWRGGVEPTEGVSIP